MIRTIADLMQQFVAVERRLLSAENITHRPTTGSMWEDLSRDVLGVTDDDVASQVVGVLRELNPAAAIVVRCRYQADSDRAQKAGAGAIVSEQAEASGALLRWCERFVSSAPESGRLDFGSCEENQ